MNTSKLPEFRATIRLLAAPAKEKNLLALADLTIAEHFVIKGIRILTTDATVEAPARLFVGFPALKGKGTAEYYDIAHPITSEAYHAVRDTILKAYARATGKPIPAAP
jgi:DNA-binding cell septation regulator SpoVG